MGVGERITQLRKQSGYSRTVFAEKIGIPHTTLRNYETGAREPGHSFLIKMAREFSVSTDYLLCLTDNPAPGYMKKSPAPAEAETEEDVFSHEYGARIIKALQLLGFIGEGQDLTERQQILMLSIYNILKLEFGKPNDFRGGVERAV